ncbi:MAG: hypothetical protein HC795_08190 [Coleofasciculaceae cyanobacterium RL_1_1]|nr:hypothetical protein [Coleofasciculaceae cyanobacterium RL_1_1]
MTWTPQQKAEFRNALVDVYRNYGRLKIFFSDAIGLSLDSNTASGDLNTVCFDAIEIADAETDPKRSLAQLHREFCQDNPHHPYAQKPAPSSAPGSGATPIDRDRAVSPNLPSQPAPQATPPVAAAPGNPRAVILTALELEVEAVCEFLPPASEVVHQGAVYEQTYLDGKHHRWDLLLVQTGDGSNDAALETSKAIQYFNPSVVLFVGVAGGLKDVRIGDVVAASQVYGYESYKAAETVQARIKTEQSSYALVSRARYEKRKRIWLQQLDNTTPDVYIEPIAAGEKVVASTKSTVYEFLRQYCNDAVAVEMEGYGFLRAAYANQPLECLVVRGISDLIDNKNEMPNAPPEGQRQRQASRNAAAFALQVLSSHQIEDSILGKPPSPEVNRGEWQQLYDCLQTEDFGTIAPLLSPTFYQNLLEFELASYPDPKQFTHLSQVCLMLERYDRLDLAVAWVKRIMDEIHGSDRDVPPAIADWYRQHSREPYSPPIREVADAPEKRLVMTFQPKLSDEDETVWVSAELHRSAEDEVPIALLDPDYSADLSEGGQCIHEALRAAFDKAGCDRSEIASFEIFLSWQHLDTPVTRWKIPSGMRTRELWQVSQGVMVRMLDRLVYRYDFQTWQTCLSQRWQPISSVEAAIPVACRYECDAELCDDRYLRSLEREFRDSQRSVFLRWGVFPESVKQELACILIDWGVPMMLWSLQELARNTQRLFVNLSQQLLEGVNPYNAAAFSEALALELEEDDSPLMHMGLICDRPDFLPNDLERLWLRQP